MRILISYEESYYVYSDALERAIRGLHPEVEVTSCSLAEIAEQLESFDPHLVVSSGPNTVDPGGRLRGTGSLPSQTNRPKPASAGGAGRGSTPLLRRCCRSLTK